MEKSIEKNRYKFLVFDVDNTITEGCQEITDEIAEVLNDLKEELVFISGTHAFEIKRMISSKVKRYHHILANVGTNYWITGPRGEKEVYNDQLGHKEKNNIIFALKKLKEKYGLEPLTSEEDQIQDRGYQITMSILGRNAPKEKKDSYDPNGKKRKEFIDFLIQILGGTDYEFGVGGTTSIDITRRGVDKGSSLERFMKMKNLKREDLIFLGDKLSPGGNDYPVIRTGIKCLAVDNPKETLEILRGLI